MLPYLKVKRYLRSNKITLCKKTLISIIQGSINSSEFLLLIPTPSLNTMNLAGNSLFDLMESDPAENDDENISVQKVLETIKTAWRNEKLSPELLPNKMEYVDCMLEQIKQMEENIEKLRKDDIRIEIHRMEIERIRYVITSYLRIRVEKIEKFAFDIVQQDTERSTENAYLSPDEMKYARAYLSSVDNHCNKYLNLLPPNLRTLEDKNKVIRPDLNSYVFLRAGKDVPNVYIKDMSENKEDEFVLDEGSQHILPYESIAESVKNGDVELL
uniref:DNA replication complex GINS protein SLD5 n=2 Tax=Cacopsylla melanoneura TaxID=428564 RepID=A0A8D8VB59_9HEMI